MSNLCAVTIQVEPFYHHKAGSLLNASLTANFAPPMPDSAEVLDGAIPQVDNLETFFLGKSAADASQELHRLDIGYLEVPSFTNELR